MDWHEITHDWGQALERLRSRFPHIDRDHLADNGQDRDAVARHLAETHHLTLFEAREELDDWLFTEVLAGQIDRMAG